MAKVKIAQNKGQRVAMFVSDDAGTPVQARTVAQSLLGVVTTDGVTIDVSTGAAYPVVFATHADQATLEALCDSAGHTVINRVSPTPSPIG